MNESTYWFDVSVYDTIFVDIFYGREHLLEESKHVCLHELSGMTLLVGSQVLSFQVHHDEILLV